MTNPENPNKAVFPIDETGVELLNHDPQKSLKQNGTEKPPLEFESDSDNAMWEDAKKATAQTDEDDPWKQSGSDVGRKRGYL